MSKYFNKTVAFLIALVLSVAGITFIVYAHFQMPIPGTIGISGQPAVWPHHMVRFNFTRPNNTGSHAVPPHRPGFDGQTEGYDFLMRNATTGQVFNQLVPWHTMNIPVTDASITNIQQDIPLTVVEGAAGSIISFRVLPFHYHYEQVGINPITGDPVFDWVRASFPPGNPAHLQQEVLFMTDINVDVENIGGNMVVIWDNPVFDGLQVFPRFRIRYGIYGQVTFTDRYVDASMWQVLPGNRLSFTIPQSVSLIPGMRYSVDVLPLGLSGSNFPSNVSVGDESFPIARNPGRVYVNNDFYLRPYLDVRSEGANYLLATWAPIPDGAISVTRVELWSATNLEDIEAQPPIGTARILLTLPNTVTTHTVRTPIPTQETWFVVLYHMSDGSVMRSNEVIFHPDLVGFTPYNPRIIAGTYSDAPLTLDLTWEAFTRPPYTAPEVSQSFNLPGFGLSYLDRNLEYRVWITDELDLLSNLPALPLVALLGPDDLAAPRRETIGVSPLVQNYVFDHSFTNFVSRGGASNPIVDNRVYYIAIQAIRTEGGVLSESQVAFYAIFVPPAADLSLIPPIVDVRTYDVSGDTITIEWSSAWWEIYNPATHGWYSIIGNRNGGPDFGDTALSLNHVLLWDEDFVSAPSITIGAARVRDAIAQIGLNADLMPIRLRDFRNLPNRTYEINVATQANVLAAGGYEEYVRQIINTPGVWLNIGAGTPVNDTALRRHTVPNLVPNTSYFIFFRPVNLEGPAHYPTFTTGTTIATRPPITPDLTVPILEVIYEDTTDHSITLRFNGTFELEFDMYFSELLADFPEGGGRVPVTSEFIRENGIENDGYIYITVPNLFPGTWYHFWIRSRLGAETSIWSNPVSEQTLPIQRPQAPNSIIRASNTSLAAINTEHGLELNHNDAQSLILELGRIFSDQQNNNAPPTTAYTTNNDYATWHPRTGHRVSYIAAFGDLVANRTYYTRARTVLTVSRQGLEIERSYSYVWQLATSPEFLDAIEIIIPEIVGTPTPGEVLQVESDFGPTFPFHSGMDDSEFDSDQNPDMFPLPDQDFYFLGPNSANNFTLTYRLRGNRLGADGNRDNQVSERFISRLIRNRTFNFEVDMSSWQGAAPIQNRRLEIPLGIIEAFDERRINLTIDAGNLSLTIPYRSLITEEVRRIPGLNRFSIVEINLETGNIPTINAAANLVSSPHIISISVSEGSNTVEITEFLRELRLEMDTPASHANFNNAAGYIHHRNSGGWARQNSAVDQNIVSFRTRHAGGVTVISREPANTVAGAGTAYQMMYVTSVLNITDMVNYNELAPIHPNQFNQIVGAVAMRRQTVAMNEAMNQGLFTSLGRGGMLVTGTSVSRAAGISSLVRLLEVRTGSEVAFFPELSDSMFPDMADAPASLQRNLLKAESLGFIRGNALLPDEAFTFGDLMYILYIIFQTS